MVLVQVVAAVGFEVLGLAQDLLFFAVESGHLAGEPFGHRGLAAERLDDLAADFVEVPLRALRLKIRPLV